MSSADPAKGVTAANASLKGKTDEGEGVEGPGVEEEDGAGAEFDE